MIANGTDHEVPNKRTGVKPLHYAADVGDAGIVTMPLLAGSNPSARDNDGWTPLHYAGFDGHAEIVAMLLDAGADAKVKDKKDRTPLAITDQFAKRLKGPVYARLVKATK